jgi:hypothetical protein
MTSFVYSNKESLLCGGTVEAYHRIIGKITGSTRILIYTVVKAIIAKMGFLPLIF